MSNNVGKYDELDKMPTERLRTLLSLDIDEVPGVDLDPETIAHIMEVIRAREEAAGTALDIDSAAAWKDFVENYKPSEDEDETDDEEKKVVPIIAAKRVRLKRFIITIAAVLVLLVGGTVAAGANGIDLWGVVVKWASQTFGLDNDMEYGDKITDKSVLPCKDLQELLDLDCVTDQMVPTWLPGGFKQTACKKDATPQMDIYQALYVNGDKTITIQIFKYHEDMGAVETYEKLPTDYKIYSVGGVDHYISQNSDGSLAALWNTENCECSIIATVTETEMEQIITSIYGG